MPQPPFKRAKPTQPSDLPQASLSGQTKRVSSLLVQLIAVRPDLPEVVARRSRLLAGMLLVIVGLNLISLPWLALVNTADEAWWRAPSAWITIGTGVGAVLLYLLNRAGRFTIAAMGTVALAGLGAWASLLNFALGVSTASLLTAFPFLSVSLLLSSLLLTAQVTVGLALIHILGGLALLMLAPGLGGPDGITALMYIGFISIFIVAAAALHERDERQIERQLRDVADSAEQFHTLFEASPDAVLLIEPSGAWPILDGNSAACRMNGYTRDELIGQSIDILNLTPGDAAERSAYLDQLREHDVSHIRTMHRRKDGVVFPIEVSTSLITLGGREVVLGIDRDITDRERAEEALRASRAQLVEALTIARLANWEYDVVNDQFTVNDQFYALLRTTAEREGGYILPFARYAERFVHPDDLAVIEANARKADEATDPNYSGQHDHRIIYADGEIGSVTIRFRIEKDSQGRTIRTRGAMQDITERKRAEEALRLSEERFQLVAYATNDAVWDLDLLTGQRWWNAGVGALFGYPPDLVGADQAWWEAQLHPDDRDKVLASFQAALQSEGRFWSKEYRYRRADGAYAYVFDRGYIIADPHGRPIRIIGAMMDVTERKRAEDELRGSEVRFHTAFDDAAVGMALVAPDGRWLQVNEALCHLLGYTQDELLGMTLPDVTYPDDQAVNQIGTRQMLAGEFRTYEMETRYRRKSGQVITVLVGIALVRNELGEPLYFILQIQDITRGKEAEEALREAEARFRSAFDDAAIGMALVAPDGRWLQVNQAVCDLVGYSSSELLATTFQAITHPDDLQTDLDYVRQMLDGTLGTYQMEKRYFHKTGRTVWVLLSVSLVRGRRGEPLYFISQIQDIAERKQAEEALQTANDHLTESLYELEQRTREITLLNEMSDQLQSCLTTDEAYAIISRLAHQILPKEAGTLLVISASRNLVEAVAAWGGAPPDVRAFAPDDCWALRRGRMHVVEAISNAPGQPPDRGLVCRHIQPPLPAAYLCLPVIAQGETLGLLMLQSAPDGPATLPEAERRLAETVGNSIGLAVANLKLRETLRNQSIRDPLTSLFNRRYMEESLERELHRAERGQYPVGIIMLDLDHFKRFNDTFGHAAGDVLLKELGNFLSSHVRGGDIACRYGGEEFTLILPEAPLAVTRQRAEHLRADVHHLHAMHSGQPLGPVTISAGVAVFPDHGQTAEAVLRMADAALYRAKREGRDRVVAAE